MVDIIGDMEPNDAGGPLRFEEKVFPWVGALGSSRVCVGGEKVRKSPGVDPRIIPAFCNTIPLIGARSDLH